MWCVCMWGSQPPASEKNSKENPPRSVSVRQQSRQEFSAVFAGLCLAPDTWLAHIAAAAGVVGFGPACVAQVRELGGQACLHADIGEELGHGDGPVLPQVAVECHQRFL